MKVIYKRQFTKVISNIFAVYVLLVNFRDVFEHVIVPVRKLPENGLGLDIYPIYLEDSETRINLV